MPLLGKLERPLPLVCARDAGYTDSRSATPTGSSPYFNPQTMKLPARILIGLSVVALVGYAGYTTVRIRDLDARLRAADVRLQAADAALIRISAAIPRPDEDALPDQAQLEKRVRRLEEELNPKIRLLGETGNR